jgi:hypothetical protein
VVVTFTICNITALAAIDAQRIVMKLTADPRKVVEAFVAALVSEGINQPWLARESLG